MNWSEWEATTFVQMKNNRAVKFLSDFRKLNKIVRRKKNLIPEIQYMLLNLEGLTYASYWDLNMGYYHIELSLGAKQICTIVLPWGKYKYQKLHMGICNSSDIFQENIRTI